jgi:hypothetical protein
MYAVSLSINSTFKLNIHNQCSNVDLVSPTYVTDYELKCYRPPGYKVYAGDTMRSAFIVDKDYFILHKHDSELGSGNESCGVLIYKLQRGKFHGSIESSEDTSSVAHLLVIWKVSRFRKLYADVLLVEHDKRLDWNKHNLRTLYYENIDRFRSCSDSATETWLLNDSAAWMTTLEIMNEGCILDITISEVERDNNTMLPAHIDLMR